MYTRRKTVILFSTLIMALFISVFLISFKKTDIVYAETNPFSGGDGREATPYQISTADDFCALEEINTRPTLNGYFGVYFTLTADIDLNGRTINPIGTQLYPFKGHLNGAGFSIKNVSITSSADYTGLFGAISSDASLKNVNINGEISGNSNVGGLVGLNQGIVSGCVNHAAVQCAERNDYLHVGGICGYNENVISDCYNTGSVLGYGVNTGGIVGDNAAGSIRNCFNAGTVQSEYYGAGGIAGNNEAIISSCFNNAPVSAYSTAGGIAGSNNETAVIENTYNHGVITVENNMAGGISGGNEGAIYNSYNSQNIIATSQKGAICGYISTNAKLESCFASSDSFKGNLTFKGSDFPDSAILRDVDLSNGDAVTNHRKAAALSTGRGDGVWSKRSFDETFCYLPELSVFFNSTNPDILQYSKDSAKLNRQTTEVSLGTLSYVYNGKPHEPDVYRGEELLVRNLDYSVKYSNNINAGEEGNAVAEITFLNYFKGSTTKNFSVTKQPISVNWSEEKFYYTGKVQYPTVTVGTGRVGDENITFEYLYDSNIDMGTHTVTVQLAQTNAINNNYYFEPETIEYEILKTPLVLEWDTKALYYNGLPQYPKAEITDGIKENDSVNLIYSEYSNNINADTDYTVRITCDNDNYGLDLTHSYKIEKKPITAEFEIKDFYYNGQALYPIICKVHDVIGDEQVEFIYTGFEKNIPARSGYTVIATLADTEINSNYSFIDTAASYEIKRQPITVAFSETLLTYNASAQYPSVSAESGVVEGEEVVFQISDYSANINATIEQTYSIVVTLDPSYAVNENYILEPTTHYYGISQAEMTVAWDEKSLPLIYNAMTQHPIAVIVSEVYDDDITLLYGDCNSINAGKNYKLIIDTDNKNYQINNTLEYEIEPLPIVLDWKGESNLVYNGSVQHPDAEIVTPTYDLLELTYGVCNSVNVGQGYTVDITCDNPNYKLINKLTYSITPKMLDISWSNETFHYNGSAQHPKAIADGQIGDEQVSIIYTDYENNSDVGILYTVTAVLDNDNKTNRNYILNSEHCSTQYRINKKQIEIVNIKAVDREYNGKTNVEIEGGELVGIIPGDDVTFTLGMAALMNASAGENKSVMFMPALSGEHSYRYRVSVPEITVNIHKAKFDTSDLKFNDLSYLYDGNIKVIELQGEIPNFIQYEITGNKQFEVGEHTVNVHFIYNSSNVEPVADIETKWYIVASEYSAKNLKLDVISGNLVYGATFVSEDIVDVNRDIFPPDVNYLYGFNSQFYKDGNQIGFNGSVQITLSLDKDILSKSGLNLYGLTNGELKELDYEITDSQLVFVTNHLTDFYIAVEKSNAIWIGLGVGIGVLLLVIFALLIIFLVLRRRKNVVPQVATTAPNVEVVKTTQKSVPNSSKKHKPLEVGLSDQEFVIDGIYCRSYQSFLASLNYKDRYRQTEICSYPSEKANRCAAGKGNGKRKDLYWQGKKITKMSDEYQKLLEKANRLQNST